MESPDFMLDTFADLLADSPRQSATDSSQDKGQETDSNPADSITEIQSDQDSTEAMSVDSQPVHVTKPAPPVLPPPLPPPPPPALTPLPPGPPLP